MFEKLRQSKLMFWSVELLVLAALVFVSSKISFLFSPIVTFVSTLFAPVLVAGFLYYMLNPLVNRFKKLGLSRNKSILIVFLLLIGGIALLIGMIIPQLVNQISKLADHLPQFIKSVEQQVNAAINDPFWSTLDIEQYLQKIDLSFGTIMKNIMNNLGSGVGAVFSTMASAVVVIVTAPFILFYMLKDGHKLVPFIQKNFPSKHTNEIAELLHKMSETISKYISGQALECLFVATATIIGYWLAGINYAFLFGCIAGMTNIIPYLGPYLGLAPAVFVTVFTSPVKAILACIVVLVVQQIDSNIIYPNVIGKSLDIHPLTIILILLAAGNIAGLLGMILAIPLYAVCKTVVIYLYNILLINGTIKKGKATKE